MNKKVFLADLKQRLKHLPKEDREDALDYYEEYLQDMELDDTDDVIGKIGHPKDIAREIISNCTAKHIDNQKEEGGVKNSAMMIWLIILAVCAAPVALPIIGVVLILLFALLIVVISLVFAIGIAGFAFLFAGISSCIVGIFALGFAQKMVCTGIGLIGISIGLLFAIVTIKSAEWSIRGIAKLFQKIFMRKKVA